ncbi:MAG: slipin family protein [Candidatus Hodarchaeales archaeon]|jgi:regulator of protease activity HflC (stomatin/prohibitin superfamily)
MPPETDMLVALATITIAIVIILYILNIKIIQEYEKTVVFRFGRAVGIRGPGLIFLLRGIEKGEIMDMRLRVLDIPRQEVMTVDNVPVHTNAICFYRVENAMKAIIEVEEYRQAIYQLAQATTRSVVGASHLDEVLSKRDQINNKITEVTGQTVFNWGIKVEAVEIKDVELPESMKRAMARQAEAERDKRGRIIQAEGEGIAAELLADASVILSGNPEGLHLRTLQTLTEIGAEHHTRTIMVLPVEVLRAFGKGETD